MSTPAPPPFYACAALAIAQQQLNLMLSGQQPTAIETPNLGRVEFNKMSVGDLQRYVDSLTAQCNAQNAAANGCGTRPVRKPFSFEAWP